MNAAIDLIVPFYGDPSRLQDLVRSVQAQTSPDWRLTVVDDASPAAGVGDWLTGLDDPRIRYLRNRSNLGVAGNFARCLDLAEADLIAFPGDDDLLLSQYVATVVEVAQRTGAVLVQPGVRVIDAAGSTVRPLGDRVKDRLSPDRPAVLEGERLARSLLVGNWAYFPSLCWRREATAAVGFRPDLGIALDLRLILELVLAGGALAYEPATCFAYRRHAESVSSRSALDVTRFEEEAQVFAWAEEQCERREWHEAARAARGRLTSRLHAVSLLPAALRAGIVTMDATATRRLLAHALRR